MTDIDKHGIITHVTTSMYHNTSQQRQVCTVWELRMDGWMDGWLGFQMQGQQKPQCRNSVWHTTSVNELDLTLKKVFAFYEFC